MWAHRALLVFAALLCGATALRCWKCGQYSDGVGSITPCTNATGATLAACGADHKYCIKYVSELTTVRDCVPTCTEKEWWGARTFCCDLDDCNSADGLHLAAVAALGTTLAFVVAR